MLVEEYQAVGSGRVPLVLAVNSANELLGLPVDGSAETDNGAALQSSEMATAAQNDQALAELKAMMGGIGA